MCVVAWAGQGLAPVAVLVQFLQSGRYCHPDKAVVQCWRGMCLKAELATKIKVLS